MSKQTLYKLFYKDEDEYLREYDARFNNEDTIHLDIEINNYPAFICPTSEMYKRIISIERTDKKVNSLCEKLPGIAIEQFTERCLIDEIVLTNNIEGVYSTRQEIGLILRELSNNNKRERFTGLVLKYQLLMSREEIPIKLCRDIRKIYDDIFYEEIKKSNSANLPDGEIFRKKSVSVFSPTQKEIHHGLMPESRIIAVMEKALCFLNNEDIDLFIRIAAFHYFFGYIHPFYDGNGRTSRFISSYMLSRELNHLIGYRISYTVKENIRQYYEAFKICNHPNNRGDLTPFIEMFLKIIDISMTQLCEALEKRTVELKQYFSGVDNLPSSEHKDMNKLYYILIQAALFSNMGISQKELLRYMDISYNTLRLRMKLIPEKMLIKTTQKRENFYMLDLNEANHYLNMV